MSIKKASDYQKELLKHYELLREISNRDVNKEMSPDELKEVKKKLREGNKAIRQASKHWRTEVEARMKKLKKGEATQEDMDYLKRVLGDE